MPGEAIKRAANPLSETTRELKEARRILESVETQALAGVAQMLAETAESLAHTAERLQAMQPESWLTAEQAARYLSLKNAKAFENLVMREGIPTYYPSKRQPRWSRKELDRWMLTRERQNSAPAHS